MSEDQGDGQGGGAITEWTQKYNLPQGEEPLAVAMVIGTKSGKIFIQSGDQLTAFLSLTAHGIQVATEILHQQINQSKIVKPKIILPNNIRYPKFGRN